MSTTTPANKTGMLPEKRSERPVTSLQWCVFILCFLAGLLDGFDSQALGLAIPLVAKDLAISRAAFGPVLSLSQAGFVIGALAIGLLADRFGRKRLLVASLVLFGISSLATSFATSIGQIMLFRFITGIGLGGAAPCFMSIVAEYAPARWRAFMITATWCGLPAGGLVAGLVATWLTPLYGWHVIFIIGGLCPLLLGGFVLRYLPESTRFLTARGDTARRDAILSRAPTSEAREIAEAPPGEAEPKASPAQLFSDGVWKTTLPIWTAQVAISFMIISLLSWNVTLLTNSGVAIVDATFIMAMLNAMSIPGNLLGGALFDRVGPYRTIVTMLAIASGILLAIGQTLQAYSFPLLALSMLLGLFMTSGAGATQALTTLSYSSGLRSTGVGWATGIGRIGGVAGPLIIGLILAGTGSSAAIYSMLAAVLTVAIISVLLLRINSRVGREI